MVEIVGRVARHADLLHHPARARIGRYRDRYDLLQPRHLEAEGEHGPRAFGRVPKPPMLGGEAPSDLDGRREVCFEAGRREAHEPRERRDAWDLHGPEPEAVLVEMALDPGDLGVAVRP